MWASSSSNRKQQKRSTQKSEANIAPVWVRQGRNCASDFFFDLCCFVVDISIPEHVRQAALIGQHVGGPSFSSSFFSFSPPSKCQGGSQPPLGKRGERTYTFLCQFSLTFSLRARPREQKRKCCQWAQGTSNQRLGGDTQFLGTLVSLCKHFVFFSCRSVCGVVAFYFWMEGTGSPRPVGEAQGKELQKPLGTLRFLM